jgi:cytochrome c biogenesis protein CcmG, thiol:disulfide interchange protein DsbE
MTTTLQNGQDGQDGQAGREAPRRRLARYLIVAGIVLLVGVLFVVREFGAEESAILGDGRPEIGSLAPDFVLDTPDGPFRLSDARGEVVVLNFWATWCGPCLFEMPEFQEVHEERGPEGIRIVAVNLTSADSREAAMRFVDQLGLTFTIAFDDTGSVAQRYGVLSLPATFFIDRDGITRARSYGPVLGERLDNAIATAQHPEG